MKRLSFFLGITAIFIFLSSVSLAETVGNPADLNTPHGRGIYSAELGDFVSFNVGFDGEYLIEKKFDYEQNTSSAPELEGAYYMARVSCTLFNRIQPYAKIGYSNLEMSWQDPSNGSITVEAGNALAWGGGIKAYLWEFEGLGLKVFSTASFRVTKPDRIDSLKVGNNTGNINEKKFEIFERQATAGISREFTIPGHENVSIVPYFGGAWSETTARVRMSQSGNIVNAGANGQKTNWGLFLGTDFLFTDNFSLNIEGRFIDQKAVSAGFTALF